MQLTPPTLTTWAGWAARWDRHRARGRKGGRPRCDPHKLRQALKLYEAGQHTVAEIEELTGIKKATLYRARKARIEKKT